MYVHITSVCVELVLVGVDKLTEAPLKFGVELTAKVTFPFTSFAVSVPDISVLTFPEPDMSPLNVVGESSIVIEISWVVLKSFESVASIVKLSLPFDEALGVYTHIALVWVELIVTVVIDTMTPLKFGPDITSKLTFPVLSLAIKVPDMSVFACPEPEISPLNVVGKLSAIIEITCVDEEPVGSTV